MLSVLLSAIPLFINIQNGAASRPFELWHYERGATDPELSLKSLALNDEKPEDVRETVKYRGGRRRYVQIRYGSPNSARIVIALDEVSDTEFDLYVDTGRTRTIADADLVKPEPNDNITTKQRRWTVDLAVADAEANHNKPCVRRVQFILGSGGRTLRYGTAGRMEGTVTIDGRAHGGIRSDGDGNGFVNDGIDPLWIDLDGDGKFDALTERFVSTSMLTIGGARYVVHSDRVGSRLDLQKLTGAGNIQLGITTNAKMTACSATLASRDGVSVRVDGNHIDASAPVGEYRVEIVTMTFADPGGGETWNYVFSDDPQRREPRWHKLDKDQSIMIDPVGVPDFFVSIAGNSPFQPGQPVGLQTRLYTGDGLLINTCYRGTSSDTYRHNSPEATLNLIAPSGGARLDTAQSGFA
ncbi:MAG: hypothetical protein HY286_03040 [Planctomycetes bacterium]|nr:hypothetical protein [Planctomycetota bacterium]